MVTRLRRYFLKIALFDGVVTLLFSFPVAVGVACPCWAAGCRPSDAPMLSCSTSLGARTSAERRPVIKSSSLRLPQGEFISQIWLRSSDLDVKWWCCYQTAKGIFYLSERNRNFYPIIFCSEKTIIMNLFWCSARFILLLSHFSRARDYKAHRDVLVWSQIRRWCMTVIKFLLSANLIC